MAMSDINILPIFNQADPNIWDDFLYIRNAATRYSCGYSMSESDIRFALNELMSGWKRRGFNFAFGAYDGFDMVGFIQGDCIKGTATVRGLYVLPEYMGQKIGGKLLKMAERVSTFGATYMDLISLPRAQKFYEHYEYQPVFSGSNHYEKPITNKMRVRSMVVPVFKSTNAITKACTEISKGEKSTFDARIVNEEHAPMFVYIDSFAVIQGFVVRHSLHDEQVQEEIHIHPSQPVNFVTRQLKKEMEILKKISAARTGRKR